jgi:hypothetical protein
MKRESEQTREKAATTDWLADDKTPHANSSSVPVQQAALQAQVCKQYGK